MASVARALNMHMAERKRKGCVVPSDITKYFHLVARCIRMSWNDINFLHRESWLDDEWNPLSLEAGCKVFPNCQVIFCSVMSMSYVIIITSPCMVCVFNVSVS